MRLIKSIIILGVALVALSPFFVYGQLLDPVDFTLKETPEVVKAGDVFYVKIDAEIEEFWHLYSVDNDPGAGPYPTTFTSVTDGLVIAGHVDEDDPEIAFDPNFNTELGWHSNRASFNFPLAFYPETKGEQIISIEVLYQVCDDKSCLPPKTKKIESEILVSGVSQNPYNGFNQAGALYEQNDKNKTNHLPGLILFGCIISAIIIIKLLYIRKG